MRILITSIVDLKRVTHNRVHVFAEYLSRKHHVTVLCLNAWWLDRSDGRGGNTEYHRDPFFQALFDRTTIRYLNSGREPALLQEITSLRTLGTLLREIDLPSFDVHVNCGNLAAGYFVARSASHLGIPTVFDIADDLRSRFASSPQVPTLLRGPVRFAADALVRANAGAAAKVTFVTQVLKDAYRLAGNHSVVVPNGVHLWPLDDCTPGSLRNALNIEKDFVVGFVGVLLPRVDLDLMFAAMARLSQKLDKVKLLVVGGGDRLQEARKLSESYGVAARTLLTGYVPLREVPSYISCMDVCLIPLVSTTDCQRAFPIKLAEYMACEKPVVSTPLAGVREAVGDGVLYARDSDELVTRIAELHRDPDHRRRMGSQGRAFVEQHYDWDQICRRFEAILAETVEESSYGASS